jgi:hypothetical protein
MDLQKTATKCATAFGIATAAVGGVVAAEYCASKVAEGALYVVKEANSGLNGFVHPKR